MRKSIVVFLTVCLGITVSAQEHKRCGYKEIQKEAEAHPEYERYLLNKENLIKNFQSSKMDTVIIIPVVVHVIHRLPSENISDAQIQSQINVLNEDYRKMNADTTNVAAGFSKSDVKLEFSLAIQDPNGNPTNGITRTATTVDNICNTSQYYNLVPAWNHQRYLNIWVCDVGDLLLGFAYPPNTPGVTPQEDGVVIGSEYFGTTGTAMAPYDRGRTTTHEVGHFFDLLHPWGNDQNPSCSTDDMISDTPNQDAEVYNCPGSRVSCGSNDMLSNFMGYIDDNCMGNFTLGQKNRMRTALYTQRDSLQYGEILGLVSLQEIDELKKTQVFPNPFRDVFTVSFTDKVSKKDVRIEMYDISGKQINPNIINTSAKRVDFSLKQYPTGIYFVKLGSGNSSVTKKLIKY